MSELVISDEAREIFNSVASILSCEDRAVLFANSGSAEVQHLINSALAKEKQRAEDWKQCASDLAGQLEEVQNGNKFWLAIRHALSTFTALQQSEKGEGK